MTVSKELPLRQGEGGHSTQRTPSAEMQKRERGLLVTLASCRSPMAHGASRSPRQAGSWREKHRPLVSCKQEPSTLRGLLLGMGAFSGVCPHHRAEGSLPRLGLSLVFPQRKELRPRDGRGCPLSYGKHRLFPLSVEIGQASLPWV